jgi:hypothetical protein
MRRERERGRERSGDQETRTAGEGVVEDEVFCCDDKEEVVCNEEVVTAAFILLAVG